jgi:hypothetical protein
MPGVIAQGTGTRESYARNDTFFYFFFGTTICLSSAGSASTLQQQTTRAHWPPVPTTTALPGLNPRNRMPFTEHGKRRGGGVRDYPPLPPCKERPPCVFDWEAMDDLGRQDRIDAAGWMNTPPEARFDYITECVQSYLFLVSTVGPSAHLPAGELQLKPYTVALLRSSRDCCGERSLGTGVNVFAKV